MKITVNGEPVPAPLLEQELQNARRESPGLPEAELLAEARERAVEWALIGQAAQERVIEVPADEVEAGFERLCEEHGGKTAFFERFNLTGKDELPIRRDLERNLKVTRFLDELAAGAEPPAEEDLRAFYEANRERFIEPEKRHVAHMVRHPQKPEEEESAFEVLKEVRDRLRAGEDFLALAESCSECRDSTPDLGTFPRGQMVPEFERVVFSMEPGEVSPVFQTRFGLHIATVLERVPARLMAFEECRERIQEALRRDCGNEVIARWVDARKAEAEVVVEDDAEEPSADA